MHKQKKIVIVSNTSWFIYNFHLALLQTLQENGYRVAIIAPKDDYSVKLEALGMEYHEIKMNNKGTNPVEDVKLIYDFYTRYKKTAADVILQYTIKPNIYGSMAAGMLGIPVISSITGLGTVFLNDSLSSFAACTNSTIPLSLSNLAINKNRKTLSSLGRCSKGLNFSVSIPDPGISSAFSLLMSFDSIKSSRS